MGWDGLRTDRDLHCQPTPTVGTAYDGGSGGGSESESPKEKGQPELCKVSWSCRTSTFDFRLRFRLREVWLG